MRKILFKKIGTQKKLYFYQGFKDYKLNKEYYESDETNDIYVFENDRRGGCLDGSDD